LLSDALLVIIALVCQFPQDLLGPYFNETQDFDGKFHMFQTNMQGHGVCSKPFPFIYGLCLNRKSSQDVGCDVKPLLQGAHISYVVCWQGKNITNCRSV
jgi:hypothetical protein